MVLHLHQRATQHLALLEYDIQFRMELSASADKQWKERDPWQYVACLPGQCLTGDPFDHSEIETAASSKTKGKRPFDPEGEKGQKHTPKKPKKAGWQLFNLALRGCPYSRDCIIAHSCTNCGTFDDHRQFSCLTLQGPSSGQKPENHPFKEDLSLGVRGTKCQNRQAPELKSIRVHLAGRKSTVNFQNFKAHCARANGYILFIHFTSFGEAG